MNKTMVANGTPDLRRYYEELKGVEHAKNQLIEVFSLCTLSIAKIAV